MTPLETSALKALAGEASVNARAAIELLDASGASASDCESADARMLWGAIEAALRAGEPLDAVVLSSRCPGVSRALVVDVVVDAHLGVTRQRLALLREKSLRRQYVEALRQVARLVTDETQPLALGVVEAQKLFAAWQDETAAIRPMDDSVLALVDELEAVQQGRRATTVPTDMEALDSVIGGLQPTLTMVGALPGVGKSALVGGILRNLSARGVKSGLLSLEDERAWLTRRMVAEVSQVPVFVLANKPLGMSQLTRVGDASAAVHKQLAHVICDDRSGLTTAEVVASARRMISMGAKVVIIDHLGEIAISRSDRHDLDVSDCLRELRTVAKINRVPVVVLSHLKRREGLNTDTEPRLTDFAFSSGVERMARVALGLWRGEEGELRATVLKQTQGVAGVTVSLRLNQSAGLVTTSPATDAARNLYTESDS